MNRPIKYTGAPQRERQALAAPPPRPDEWVGLVDLPTSVTAQTAFANPNTEPAATRWPLYVAPALALSLAAIFHFYSPPGLSTPALATRTASGPAGGTAAPSASMTARGAAEPPSPVVSAAASPPAFSGAPQAFPAPPAGSSAVPMRDRSVSPPIRHSRERGNPENRPAALAVAEPSIAETSATTETVASPVVAERRQAPAPAAERVLRDDPRMRISKINAPEQAAVAARQAYAAYRKGDLASAKSRYQEALRHDPDHRDALLGLAAVAIKNGAYEQAAALYTRLLALNPQDRIASAALAGLPSAARDRARRREPHQGFATDNESALKLRLRSRPDNPLLYFALGRIYAARHNWPAARQAFFAAYRLAPERAAYAHNLAVSLDRLGQSRAALRYYRAALALAAGDDKIIDGDSVRHRMRALAGSGPAPAETGKRP